MESFAFLTPMVIQQNATEAGLDQTVIEQLLALAARIATEPALQQVDLDKAPQATGLQRAVVAHMQAGGKLRNGGFLLLPEDVEKFGQALYQGQATEL